VVKVRIPQVLQKLTENKSEVEIEGENIGEVIDNLEKNYKGIKERICDEDGKIRRFINIYVNNEDIRFLDGANTKLKDGDEVSIIPAIAGGEDSFNVQCSTFNDKWFNFERLEVYQKAVAFANEIYKITKNFPKSEIYGITNQIRRASVSISLNIAEGSGRSKREFRHLISALITSLNE
jgi:molybdopterin synthase sulfur carrier subunit